MGEYVQTAFPPSLEEEFSCMPAEKRRQLSVNLISISSAVNDLQSSRLPAVGGRRGADSTDCLVLGEASSSNLWFTELRRRTPWLSCLSRILNVTDRWVIAASSSWQADEWGKVELQENKGLGKWRGQRVRKKNYLSFWCCRWVKLCTVTSCIQKEYFIPKMTFSPVVAHTF